MKIKNKIQYICLLCMIPAVFSCSEKIDNSEFSDMLGENYNQQMLWDPDSLAFRRADWEKKSLLLDSELYSAQIEMMESVQSVSYIKYTSKSFYTEIGTSDSGLKKAGDIAQENKAVFAINGGLFNASGATTFVKVGGTVETSSTSAGSVVNGAVAFRDTDEGNEMVILSGSEAGDANLGADKWDSAIATGPVLLINGKEQDFPQTDEYTTRTARSIIGKDANGNCIMAVIDGGVTGQADGATMAEAAYIARLIGMTDAVCLAGGNASSLWSSSDGTLTCPSGNGAYDHSGETDVANIIYVQANTLFEGGDGTAANPYLIAKARQIKNMSSALMEGTTVYFELTDDIDMDGIEWTPLNYADPYMKIVNFDGKGHTIYNFTCENTSYPSFFGVLHGECRNVRFVDAKVSTTNNCCGIIGGYVGTTGKPGLIENCHVHGTVTVTAGDQPAGGIAGQINTGTAKNCSVDVTVSMTVPFVVLNKGFGGIVGEMRNNSTVENCFATGDVLGELNYNAGGIAGRNNDGSNTLLKNNIAWLNSVTGRVAAGSVTGRWKTANGVAENNYSKRGMTVITYTNNGDGLTQGKYYSNDTDYADFGIETDSAIEAAKTLGWNESIWDLSGELPRLKQFAE